MRKIMAVEAFVNALLFICVFLLLATSAFATQDENALSNERLPLTGSELEAHWGLKCQSSIEDFFTKLEQEKINNNPASHNDNTAGLGSSLATKAWIQEANKNFKKCGFIYNTAGTSRTVDCPQYSKASQILSSLLASGKPISTISPLLSNYLLNC